MRPRFDRGRPEPGHRVNYRIRIPEIRVIFEDQQLGIMPTHEAMKIAEEKGLDLVEISPRSQPPVCRICDYGKFKYDEAKSRQAAQRRASTTETKEIKFRPKTEKHDMDFKVKHIRRFLEEGNKVRLVIVFRGREVVHPQTGRNVLDRVLEACSDIAVDEAAPNMEGRRMFRVIAPKPGVVRKAQEAKKAAAAAAQAQQSHGKQVPAPVEELDEAAINADIGDDDDDENDENEAEK
jgi:translation initiation factor IF-3